MKNLQSVSHRLDNSTKNELVDYVYNRSINILSKPNISNNLNNNSPNMTNLVNNRRVAKIANWALNSSVRSKLNKMNRNNLIKLAKRAQAIANGKSINNMYYELEKTN